MEFDNSSSEGHEISDFRNQSVEDLESFAIEKNLYNIEELYDFDSVLKNLNSQDKNYVVDNVFVENCELVIGDFGNSIYFNNNVNNEIQDRLYRAPEVILGLPYTKSCDMWSFGCIIYELLTGYNLFYPLYEPLNADIHHLYLIEKHLGPIPIKMKKKSPRKRFLFDKNRKMHIKNVAEIKKIPIHELLIKRHLFSEQDALEIEHFLKDVFNFNPTLRITAKKLLTHNWLKID